MKILLTGAAGQIGISLYQYLSLQHDCRCLDINPIPDAEDSVTADILDFEAVATAMEGRQTVIHLAANPSPKQSWEDVYTVSIAGTYNVFTAAKEAGVKKIIYASSIHVTKGWEKHKKKIRSDLPVRPDSLYGVGKSFGEALGRFYADEYNICVICLRIGAFISEPHFSDLNQRVAKAWCSPRDLAQLVSKCLEKDDLGFQIFNAVSNNKNGFLDFSHAKKQVGYQPKDNSRQQIQ
ncbi:MAG: NAD(P)-dependent oxidoreductase [Oscillatoria sp. PMC 1068.18]|nr:NAD(P)-dependent oxidoreductase [Oscillatoria sp. PMC 1076.18]MEC4988175.1 NAD(P)-dependent oxidoreductase [Oscillatoria sp. PMC 1068.18]